MKKIELVHTRNIFAVFIAFVILSRMCSFFAALRVITNVCCPRIRVSRRISTAAAARIVLLHSRKMIAVGCEVGRHLKRIEGMR